MSYLSFRNSNFIATQNMKDFSYNLYGTKNSGDEIKTVQNLKNFVDSQNFTNVQKGYFESVNYESSICNISENVDEKEELIPNSPKDKQKIKLAGISLKQNQPTNLKKVIMIKDNAYSKSSKVNKRIQNQINFTPNFGLNGGKKKDPNKKSPNQFEGSFKKTHKHNLSSNTSMQGLPYLKNQSKMKNNFHANFNSLQKGVNIANSNHILNSQSQKIELQNPDTGSSAISPISPKAKGKSNFLKNNEFYQTCLQKLFEKYQKIDLIKQEKMENEIKNLTFTPKINEIYEATKRSVNYPNRNIGNNNLKSKSAFNLILKLQEAHRSGKEISIERNRHSKLKNTLDISKKVDSSVQINLKDLNKRNNSYFSISNDQSHDSNSKEHINAIISFSDSNKISPSFETKPEYKNDDNYNILNSRIKRAFSILFSRLDLNKDGMISYSDFSSCNFNLVDNPAIAKLYERFLKIKSKKINLNEFICISEKIYKKISNEMKNNFIRFCTFINYSDKRNP